MIAIDHWLFFRVFNLADNNLLIESIMVQATNWSSMIFAFMYGIGILILFYKRSPQVIPFLLAPASAYAITRLIRFFYERPRPFVDFDIESLIVHSANGSLPSMHATSAFVIGMAVWHIHKKAGRVMLFLAVLTGLSRIMVGVHYPLDILAGALIAMVVSILVFRGYPLGEGKDLF